MPINYYSNLPKKESSKASTVYTVNGSAMYFYDTPSALFYGC